MAIKQEIGQRLREFGEQRYNSMAEFAKALGVKPQNLNAYLSGKRMPGNKLENKLRDLGCDIIWLQHGINRELLEHKFKIALGNIVNAQGDRIVSKEDYEFMKGAKARGIDSLEKLDNILKSAMKVAETIAKYNTTNLRKGRKNQ
jgi:transcriptional regulator with XRE-family HTH domain